MVNKLKDLLNKFKSEFRSYFIKLLIIIFIFVFLHMLTGSKTDSNTFIIITLLIYTSMNIIIRNISNGDTSKRMSDMNDIFLLSFVLITLFIKIINIKDILILLISWTTIFLFLYSLLLAIVICFSPKNSHWHENNNKNI